MAGGNDSCRARTRSCITTSRAISRAHGSLTRATNLSIIVPTPRFGEHAITNRDPFSAAVL